ncbi:hypothetical protein V1522DRAFT_393789 [Lipomyces starkeyi]
MRDTPPTLNRIWYSNRPRPAPTLKRLMNSTEVHCLKADSPSSTSSLGLSIYRLSNLSAKSTIPIGLHCVTDHAGNLTSHNDEETFTLVLTNTQTPPTWSQTSAPTCATLRVRARLRAVLEEPGFRCCVIWRAISERVWNSPAAAACCSKSKVTKEDLCFGIIKTKIKNDYVRIAAIVTCRRYSHKRFGGLPPDSFSHTIMIVKLRFLKSGTTWAQVANNPDSSRSHRGKECDK